MFKIARPLVHFSKRLNIPRYIFIQPISVHIDNEYKPYSTEDVYNGNTYFHYLCMNSNCRNTIKNEIAVKDKYYLNEINKSGKTAIHELFENNSAMCNTEILKMLKGKNFNFKLTDFDGNTVFHYIFMYGSEETCTFAMVNLDVDYNAVNDDGFSVLSILCSREFTNNNTLNSLKKKGIHIESDDVVFPLIKRKSGINSSMLKTLIANGMKLDKFKIEQICSTSTSRAIYHLISICDNELLGYALEGLCKRPFVSEYPLSMNIRKVSRNTKNNILKTLLNNAKSNIAMLRIILNSDEYLKNMINSIDKGNITKEDIKRIVFNAI